MLGEFEEKRIELEVLDLPIVPAWPLEPLGLWQGFRVIITATVQLHEHLVVVDLCPAHHDVIDALLQSRQFRVGQQASELQIAVAFVLLPLIFRQGIHDFWCY